MNLALHLLLGVSVGALLAAAHLASLAPGVRWLIDGRLVRAMTLLIGRIIGLAAVLLALALAGHAVLIGAILGLLVTRTLIVRKAAGDEG